VHVVATAGHVDHGKSTLVRALTGMEPDRLEEERRRGLSIRLGYVWTTLEDAGEVAFVDVPGHERFVATALSGLGPVPVVLFVVAADDPWMPQAAEHLAALDALGVDRGVLAVTRADLADPGPALERARHELDRTSLAGLASVVVSGRTGDGLPELRGALADVLRTVPAPDPEGDVRLWVDRRFHVRGTGTVVTGTLPSGTIRAGDELVADGTSVRVRGVEALGSARDAVSGPARVALDLGGKAPATVRAGTALCSPAAFRATDVVDVRLVSGTDVRMPERPQLHVGGASTAVHARPLADDLVRLTLDEPLPLRVGDRALVRDPGSRDLWGIRVLDPAPPALRRRGAAAARAHELEAADGSTASEVERRGLVRVSLLRRIGVPPAPVPDGTVAVGDWLLSPARAGRAREELARLAQAPGDVPGVPVGAAARALDLPVELVPALVTAPLRLESGRVLPERERELPAHLETAARRLAEDLAREPFAAPDGNRLRELGLDNRGLATLAATGHLLRLDDAVVLLPGADEAAAEVLAALPQPFTASQARTALGTSRRVVLPLLAHLDRTRRTLRLPDDTRRIR
jgi:selenocysteine-specific elongation factor